MGVYFFTVVGPVNFNRWEAVSGGQSTKPISKVILGERNAAQWVGLKVKIGIREQWIEVGNQ